MSGRWAHAIWLIRVLKSLPQTYLGGVLLRADIKETLGSFLLEEGAGNDEG